jgi:hypothetical protein
MFLIIKLPLIFIMKDILKSRQSGEQNEKVIKFGIRNETNRQE